MSVQPQSPAEAGTETVEVLTVERDALMAELEAIKANPMFPLLEITPLTRSYDFDEIVSLYEGDEMNAFGGVLGELELSLKAVGVNMGVNQARTSKGEGRESSSGISKKGSVEFDSIADILHLPPALLKELGRRNLVKVVCGNTSWVGADDAAAQQANATSGAKFTR